MPRFVFVSSAAGGEPDPITMTAGNLDDALYGYFPDVILDGSVSGTTIGSFTLVALITVSAAAMSLGLSGDQVSALSGKSLYIDATQYTFASASDGPNYNSGEDLTEVTWTVAADFVEDQVYSVNIY
jgi:hypothetical protein